MASRVASSRLKHLVGSLHDFVKQEVDSPNKLSAVCRRFMTPSRLADASDESDDGALADVFFFLFSLFFHANLFLPEDDVNAFFFFKWRFALRRLSYGSNDNDKGNENNNDKGNGNNNDKNVNNNNSNNNMALWD